jgi:prefoldin subunit 5
LCFFATTNLKEIYYSTRAFLKKIADLRKRIQPIEEPKNEFMERVKKINDIVGESKLKVNFDKGLKLEGGKFQINAPIKSFMRKPPTDDKPYEAEY